MTGAPGAARATARPPRAVRAWQIPIRRCGADVTEVGRQQRHPRGDVGPVAIPVEQGRDRETVPEVMYPRETPGSGLKPRMVDQPGEHRPSPAGGDPAGAAGDEKARHPRWRIDVAAVGNTGATPRPSSAAPVSVEPCGAWSRGSRSPRRRGRHHRRRDRRPRPPACRSPPSTRPVCDTSRRSVAGRCDAAESSLVMSVSDIT